MALMRLPKQTAAIMGRTNTLAHIHQELSLNYLMILLKAEGGVLNADLKATSDPAVLQAFVGNSMSSERAEAVATVMLCNIPCCFDIHAFVDAIDGIGFANTYYLVYVPSHQYLCTLI